MYKKHVLFLGFVVLLMAAIFVFSGCENDDSGDPAPAQDPLKVYENWYSNQDYLQRFTLNYSIDLGAKEISDANAANAAANVYNKTSFLEYTVEKRGESAPIKTTIRDYCDPTLSVVQGGQAVPQTGASKNATTNNDTGWTGNVAGPADALGTILPGNIRGLMLYAVSPYFFTIKEDLTVEQGPGKKLTMRYTHNAGSTKLWTDENGVFDLKACASTFTACTTRMPVGWESVDRNTNTDKKLGPVGTDPSLEDIQSVMPYPGYNPNVIDNDVPVGNPAVNVNYLLATPKGKGGRFNKANLDWAKIDAAMTTVGGATSTVYEYIGKLTAEYKNNILTVKGDLVLVKK